MSQALGSVIHAGRYSTCLGKDFKRNFDYAYNDDNTSIFALLSEYHYGTDPTDNLGLFEFVKNDETQTGNEIAEKMALQFRDIEFEAATENW